MGINAHVFHMCCYAKKKYGGFGYTVTLGRQTVFLPKRKFSISLKQGEYCESLLSNAFDASRVDSIDNSDYEGANIIADMNLPVPDELAGKYDTVLDFGCSEHIFDIAQVFRNITTMCKIGGIVLHVVPANHFCGHGFYQFSPELFFSWYSETNGYSETEVFLAETSDIKNWFRVPAPRDGYRINVRSSGELYVMVISRRARRAYASIQQSDYVFEWEKIKKTEALTRQRAGRRYPKIKALLRKNRHLERLVIYIYKIYSDRNRNYSLRRHPLLKRIRVSDVCIEPLKNSLEKDSCT